MDFSVRVQSMVREVSDDDATGEKLVEAVRRSLGRGGAPPAAVIVCPERIDLVPLGPVVQANMAIPMFLAGLTRGAFHRGEPVDAVGLVGTFELRQNGPQAVPVPMAMVFLEW